MSIDLKELTAEQKAALLQELQDEKEKAEKEKAKARAAYESSRDVLANKLVKAAEELHESMRTFRKYAHAELEAMRSEAEQYGGIRSTSKGGFHVRASDTGNKVVLRRNVEHEYDERADMALELIHEFLEDTIKKRDKPTYTLIITALQRNKKGELDPARVAALLAIKDNYTDHRWVKAMNLLTESYREREISFSIEFFTRDALKKDKSICLTFAGLRD